MGDACDAGPTRCIPPSTEVGSCLMGERRRGQMSGKQFILAAIPISMTKHRPYESQRPIMTAASDRGEGGWGWGGGGSPKEICVSTTLVPTSNLLIHFDLCGRSGRCLLLMSLLFVGWPIIARCGGLAGVIVVSHKKNGPSVSRACDSLSS